MRPTFLRALLPLVLGASLVVPAVADDLEASPVLVNPQLARWVDDRPEGWSLSLGAVRDVDGPLSRVEPLPDGGAALVADASTRRWQLLAQRVAVGAGSTVEARFEVRALDLADGPESFHSTYVGLLALDAGGRALVSSVRDIRAATFGTERLVITCPPAATQVELRAFLSRRGRLELRRVGLRRLAPADSLEVLQQAVARFHPRIGEPDLHWEARAALLELGPATQADPAAFIAGVLPLLAALGDEHVVLVDPEGRRHATWSRSVDVGFELAPVQAAFPTLGLEPGLLLDGRTADGLAYLLVDSLPAAAGPAGKLEDAARRAVDAPGLLVDLRTCSGGDERVAQRMVRWWADADREYAHTDVRAGPEPGIFADLPPRRIGPPDDYTYDKPIVVLLGPGCVSSGEGMALMLRALPHARLLGRPTRGSSGNPTAVPLPNGVTLLCSTWRTRLPGGGFLEGQGVPPDERIEATPSGDGRDSLLEAGLAQLRQAVAARAARPR